jgi:hypothetical protein
MIMNEIKWHGYEYRGNKYHHAPVVAAGNPVTVTPPPGEIWLIHSLKFHYTTSAAVAMRYVRVYFYGDGPVGTPIVVYYPINFQTPLVASKLAYFMLNMNEMVVLPTMTAMVAGTSGADFHCFWRLPFLFLWGVGGPTTTANYINIDAVGIDANDAIASCHAQVHYWTAR